MYSYIYINEHLYIKCNYASILHNRELELSTLINIRVSASAAATLKHPTLKVSESQTVEKSTGVSEIRLWARYEHIYK